MHAHWANFDVPDIEIIAFDIKEHNANLPWFRKAEKRQSVLTDNPVRGTAYHLCSYISSAQKEFKAAYKLYAYCRKNEISGFPAYVLLPVFEQHESNLYEWWSGNAKYVLPFVESDADAVTPSRGDLPGEWKLLVKAAALTWTSIASAWSVIRIPDWMERGSPEYAAYERVRNATAEDFERREYLRLKEKFEGSSR